MVEVAAARVAIVGALVTRAVACVTMGATGATVDGAITGRVRQSNGYITVRSIPQKIPPPTMMMQAMQAMQV